MSEDPHHDRALRRFITFMVLFVLFLLSVNVLMVWMNNRY